MMIKVVVAVGQRLLLYGFLLLLHQSLLIMFLSISETASSIIYRDLKERHDQRPRCPPPSAVDATPTPFPGLNRACFVITASISLASTVVSSTGTATYFFHSCLCFWYLVYNLSVCLSIPLCYSVSSLFPFGVYFYCLAFRELR